MNYTHTQLMQYYYKQYKESIKTKEVILQLCQEHWTESLVRTLDENKDIHEQIIEIFIRFAQVSGSLRGDIRECEKYVSWLFGEQYNLTSRELTQLAYRIYGSRLVYPNIGFVHNNRSGREFYNPFDKFTTSQFFPLFFFFLAGIPSLFLCLGASYIPYWNIMPLIVFGIGFIAYFYSGVSGKLCWITPSIVNLLCSLCFFIWWCYSPEHIPFNIPFICSILFFITGLISLCFKKRMTIAIGSSGWEIGNKEGSKIKLFGE